MLETLCLLSGLGFSILIYVRSIRTSNFSAMKKALFFLLTAIGVTGTLFLFGVLVADVVLKPR